MLDRRLAKPAAIDADQIAIDALGYIASEPDLMQRFLDLTGIEAAGIREAAAQSGFFVCESAWNKAPVFGVIGVQTGPL